MRTILVLMVDRSQCDLTEASRKGELSTRGCVHVSRCRVRATTTNRVHEPFCYPTRPQTKLSFVASEVGAHLAEDL